MRFVSWMVCCLLLLGAPLARAAADGPSQVKIDKAQGGYRLRVDGKPFFIKGGGGKEHLDELAARGGNAGANLERGRRPVEDARVPG